METLKSTAPLEPVLSTKSALKNSLDELFNRSESKINYSLERIKRFYNAFSCQSSYKAIHVAGTNGKGSVSLKVAHALKKSGYKVGLFTSPHVFKVYERLQINGKNISEKEFEKLYIEICEKEAVLKEKLTFFEVVTLMAFIYFQREKVDYAVIEAGLGGRLDATNILEPYLVIITSIALDHTEYLGETVEKIAYEKAAIIKECKKVVIGPHTPGLVMKDYFLKVQGTFASFEEENEQIACSALKLLEVEGPFEKVKAPYRLQIKEIEGQVVIFDGAHNPCGFKALMEALVMRFPKKDFRLAISLSKSKNIALFAPFLSKYGKKVHLLEPDLSHPRLASSEVMYQELKKGGLKENKIIFLSSFEQSVQFALSEAKKSHEIVVFTGSFFLFQYLEGFK